MDTITSITKNTLVLFISKAIVLLSGFFYIVYSARYLGTEGYGIINFALALSGIFCVFADLGLTTYTAREVSKNKSLLSDYLSNIAVLKIPLVVFACLFIISLVSIYGYAEKTSIVIYFITLSFVVSSFIGLFNAIFQAFEDMEYISIGNIINSILMLLGALYIIRFNLGITSFAILYLLSNFVVLAYSLVIYIKKYYTKFNFNFSREFCKNCIKEAWPMGAMALCIIIYFRISTVILSFVKGDSAVGLFSAAYTLSELSTMIPTILISSIFPIISIYYVSSKSSFLYMFQRSVKYLFYMALPMAFIITIWADPIINLVYGNSFSGSVIALQILIWSAAIMYVTMVLGTIFVTANLQMINMKLTIIAALINIILNLIFIPYFGYVGAAFVTIVTEAFGLIAGLYILNKYGYIIDIKKIFVIPIIGILLAGISYLLMAQLTINNLIIVPISIAIYLIIICLKGVDREDLRLANNILKVIVNKMGIKNLQ